MKSVALVAYPFVDDRVTRREDTRGCPPSTRGLGQPEITSDTRISIDSACHLFMSWPRRSTLLNLLLISSRRMHVNRSFLISAIFLLLYQRIRYVASQDEKSVNATEVTEIRPMPSQLTVTSWNDMPFSGIVWEDGKWVGKGYAFYLFDLISAKLNFTYTIVPPDQHVLGNERQGILSLLYEKKVNVAVAFLPTLPEMRQFCTFGTILDESRLTVLMRRPHESATGSGLLAPFEKSVWLLLLVSVIFIGPVIYIFARIRAKLWTDPYSENYSLPSYVWFVYSSLLKQGTNIIAITDSTRMLFATWWIFVLILTSFYTANLTAFLTKPTFTLSINSLKDIVDKRYSWVSYEGRTVDFLLSQPHPNELSPLNVTRKDLGFFKYSEPTKDILNLVTTKKLFFAETHYLRMLMFEDYLNKTREGEAYGLRCTYVIMPGSILETSRAFGFPLNSSIRYTIDSEILKLVQAGVVKQTKEKDLPLADICPVELQFIERQLMNSDFLLTYKVVIAGYAIAAVIFLLEIVVACATNRGKRRKESDERSRDKSEPPSEKTDISPKSIHQNMENALVAQGKKHYINGRNYYVVVDKDGDQRLIPIRTPSAFLFQYAA